MPYPWEILLSTAQGTRSQLVAWTLLLDVYDNPLGLPEDHWQNCQVWAADLLTCLQRGEAALLGDPLHQEARRYWEKERGPALPQPEWRVVGGIIPDTTGNAGTGTTIRVAGGDPADESNTARFALTAANEGLASWRTETMGRLDRHVKQYNPEGFEHREWWKWRKILEEYAERVPQLSAELRNDPVGALDRDRELCVNLIALLRRHIALTLDEKQFLIKERPFTANPQRHFMAWNGWGKARWRLWMQIMMLGIELRAGVGKLASELRGALIDRAHEATREAHAAAQASTEMHLGQHPFDDTEFLGWLIRNRVLGTDPDLFRRTTTMTPAELEATARGLGIDPDKASDADRARYILGYSIGDELERIRQARMEEGPVIGAAPTTPQVRLLQLQAELRGASDENAMGLLRRYGLSLPTSS
jgi:hypothetical protein